MKRTNKKRQLRISRSRKRVMVGCAHKKRRTQSKKQRGGYIPAVVPAMVGSPWTPSVSGWPGVAGLQGQTNYFSMNTYPVDPQTAMISERDYQFYGGMKEKEKEKREKDHRGGGILPDDLVNLGRSMVYGVGSAYNSLTGYSAPVNPLPFKDQLVNSNQLLY